MSERTCRLGLLVALGVVVLVAASSAVAGLTPALSATTTADATVVSYSQAPGDDPVAAITFYVAAGYAALLAQPEGDVLGTATAKAVAADLSSANLALSGQIVAAGATSTITSAGATVPLSAAAVACTGTATHSAFWILNLTGSGQTLQVPAFVDDVPLTSPLSTLANNTIKICLPPPDVPAGTPGRATSGTKLVSMTLNITDVFSAAPLWYLWHATVTPYTPGAGKANAAGTVEVQSVDRTPQEVTITTRAAKKAGSMLVFGKIRAGGKGIAGAEVSILAGKTAVGKATSGPGGNYQAVVTAPAAATFSATTVVAPRAIASCSAYFAPAPCAGAWYAGFSATSEAAKAS
jgi:hypothetical protein